jgi:signal transduction histidine kinase
LILNSRLKNRIEVSKNYGKVPIINCYSGQLSQVFMNLFSNAIDALYEKITLREKDDTVNTDEWIPTLKITTEEIKLHGVDWVSVKIIDNGIGIPQDVQNYIFENFFTTKEVGKGTGIGLTICHQIISEKHNGKLSFKSIPGQQTEFEVQLPVV